MSQTKDQELFLMNRVFAMLVSTGNAKVRSLTGTPVKKSLRIYVIDFAARMADTMLLFLQVEEKTVLLSHISLNTNIK
ncbi:uncharacterized protein METZ01_LOCUS429901 [marine metagenome]|uniref:Uncharacterized protein n=1 Tax=marine metagenome TaxID=408172 RepID=A0A382Y116_9ZZZZ